MTHPMKIARIYQRVSTDQQELQRQGDIEKKAKEDGYYIAGIYKEKASGARLDRPELLRMIHDLQPGDVVIAEKMDRISRLPLPDAEHLVHTIRSKGAKISVPGLIDLSDIPSDPDDISKIILESVQELLLKLALHMARDDYETRRKRQQEGINLAKESGKYKGRKKDTLSHDRIIALRTSGLSIGKTAELTPCSVSQVKRIWALHLQKISQES